MNRAVLIAAGEYREEYVFSEKDDLVAVDGGYEAMLRQHLVPVLFVGDRDSYAGELPEHLEKIVLPCEKDDTDSLFAVKELLKRGYRSFALYGFLGGSISHTIANPDLALSEKTRRRSASLSFRRNLRNPARRKKAFRRKARNVFFIQPFRHVRRLRFGGEVSVETVSHEKRFPRRHRQCLFGTGKNLGGSSPRFRADRLSGFRIYFRIVI